MEECKERGIETENRKRSLVYFSDVLIYNILNCYKKENED